MDINVVPMVRIAVVFFFIYIALPSAPCLICLGQVKKDGFPSLHNKVDANTADKTRFTGYLYEGSLSLVAGTTLLFSFLWRTQNKSDSCYKEKLALI